MRMFITLFLLALAMTIGANQAFAHDHTNGNGAGQTNRHDDNRDGDDDDSEDPSTPSNLTIFIPCSPTHGFGCDVPPRRHREPRPHVVQVEPEDCGCEHKVIRVGARFVTVLDCYQSIEVNGREQMRYCRKDG